ncbi:OmpP1/FadL family transporter [Sphingomonas morindae]|uniref:Outer membrane protein transport protein n=1 Tax=Sphingomonas morindae TaxID=1541170 RepID=A0ABY4X4F0_9SPHN|nr:outer membrane protein transport protein [Sphingomonas morindae]USI71731.1 outer membrane protein transport protein [Sphingomonas morindae]
MLLAYDRALRGATALAVIAAGLAAASQADAAAFYLQEQSVKANGRAWSGEAAERGAQQQWWNPAAIGGITGFQAYGGVTALYPRARSSNVNTRVVRPTLALPTGQVVPGSNSAVGGNQTFSNPVNDGYLPNGGFAFPITDKLAAGLTVTSPYSFTTNYDSDSWARYSADKTRLRTYDIQPGLAFSPAPSISLGAAVNVEYVRATLSNYLPDPISAAFPDGHQYLKGDGWDVGYSFGFQFHNEKVDLGASYKSAIKHKLKGTLIVDGLADPITLAAGVNRTIDPARAQFTTPWQVNVGARYHIVPSFTVNAQVTRFGWEKFDQITLAAPVNAALPENYRSRYAYSLGFDWDVTPRWTLRGGVQRDLSPIADGERDPRVPDGNRWTFAGGTSYQLTQHLGLDASVNYTKIASNPIDKATAAYAGTPLQTLILTSGQLYKAHALVFGLGGHMTF